ISAAATLIGVPLRRAAIVHWPSQLIHHSFQDSDPGAVESMAEVAKAVHDGAADLGLVEGRVDADDLVQQTVARDRLALVVGPTHPWASRRSVKGPDLLAAEWVLRERGSGTRSEFEDVLTLWALSAKRLNVVLELPSNEAVRMAVEAGAGATVISRLSKRCIGRPPKKVGRIFGPRRSISAVPDWR